GSFWPKVTWSALYPSFSTVFTWTTRHGATLTTVTGTTRFSSSHTWVMPTFSPTIAFVAMAGVFLLTRTLRSGQARRSADSVVPGGSRRWRACTDVDWRTAGASRPCRRTGQVGSGAG